MEWVKLAMGLAFPIVLLGCLVMFIYGPTPVQSNLPPPPPVNTLTPSATSTVAVVPIPQPQPTMKVIPRYFDTPCVPYWYLSTDICPPLNDVGERITYHGPK